MSAPKRGIGNEATVCHLFAMSTITVALPEEDFAFLRAYSAAHGTSAEAFLAQQARSLREHLQAPLRSEVIAASGIIAPESDGKKAHREYLENKHA